MTEAWEFSPMVRDGLARYARLIAGLIGSGRVTYVESAGVFAELLTVSGERVMDRLGHTRPLYRPLLAYSLMRGGGRLSFEVSERETTWEGAATAAVGDRVAAAAWAALAGLAMGAPVDDRPIATMRRIVEGQQPSGGFLAAGPSDNLESLWFHELAVLHAVASFAVQAREPGLWPAVRRAVRYHVEETQPDHATNQPWGLTAFLLEPDGWPLVDSMLHAASAHAAVEGQASAGITLMLLADALYCLHQLGIIE